MNERTGIRRWQLLGFAFLMVILIISTTSTAIASQQAAKAAKNTDIIAQCSTKGTKCFNLSQINEARRTAQNKCIIDALINLPPLAERTQKRQEILDQYDACVAAETQVTTTTTTN